MKPKHYSDFLFGSLFWLFFLLFLPFMSLCRADIQHFLTLFKISSCSMFWMKSCYWWIWQPVTKQNKEKKASQCAVFLPLLSYVTACRLHRRGVGGVLTRTEWTTAQSRAQGTDDETDVIFPEATLIIHKCNKRKTTPSILHVDPAVTLILGSQNNDHHYIIVTNQPSRPIKMSHCQSNTQMRVLINRSKNRISFCYTEQPYM